MAEKRLMNWFEHTEIGRYAAEKEKLFFQNSTKHLHVNRVVQTGMHQWSLSAGQVQIRVGLDVHMDLDAPAWAAHSLDLLLMPHALECSAQPQRVLAEAYRALKPEGRLVLTGFNPYSLWRFSRWFDGRGLPDKKQCVPLPLLKKQVKALGFCVEAGQFMVYVPAVNSREALRRWRFMESAGDRWWPHAAAVYGLVLLKRQADVKLLPEFESEAEKEGSMVLGVAKAGIECKESAE